MGHNVAFLYGNCTLEDIQDINTCLSKRGKIILISSKTILNDLEKYDNDVILQMDLKKISISEEIFIVNSSTSDTYLSLLLKRNNSTIPIHYI